MLDVFASETFFTVSEVIQNAILLFALVFIYGASDFLPDTKNTTKRILIGVLIGGFAVLIMMFPWRISEGLIFDTRSVLLSITGAFFGVLSTIIAGSIAVIYRIFVGGSGVYAGVLTIVTTAGFGLLWRRFRHRLPKMPIFLEYYIFGLFAHIITILCQIALPWETAVVVIPNILPAFLGLFPILTTILAISLTNQSQRLMFSEQAKSQHILLQASIDSPKTMEIFALDLEGKYLVYNDFHKYSMNKYYKVDIEKDKHYLNYISNDTMNYRVKSCIDKALKGESFTRVFEVETNKGKFLEELYTPIRNDSKEIIGVTIFSQDVTKRKEFEQSILYLSYHDPLTGLKNRRYYTEELVRLDQEDFLPISIIMADINGLKIMNDAFGHDSGDLLLKTVANSLFESFKNKGIIARIGGDEFVILLANTNKSEAMNLIEKAKATIEKQVVEGMNISVAFGVETKAGNTPIEEIFKIAEDDMYKHKLFEISSNRNDAIKTILNTLHVKNPREEYHSKRVSEYCQKIGQILGMRKDEINLLKIIGNLHDIGKIAIDEAILNKPGKLTNDEWNEIKRHPEIGYRILSASADYAEFSEDILSHHERWDGTGYPQGLKGKEIPYRARIIAIADAYDAITSSRPYRDSLTHEFAIDEIMKNSGTQFDPMIAKKFVESFQKKKTK
ncbi:MAG: diguanylate cyclase [Firmicutes bacterium]|nr:diguanylate cyclase [Bacillota bacterium]